MRTAILGLLATVLSMLLIGCHSDKNIPDKYEQLSGIWEHKGYGEILVIGSEGIEEYEFTRKTCIKDADPLSRDEFDNKLNEINLSEDKNAFTILVQAPFISRFSKLDGLPASCHSDKIITESTPTSVFEHFWHTFNDYYAFFQKRGVDWQQQYALYNSQVTDDMTDEALFSLLSDMLSPIDDGHISLDSDDGHYSPEQPSSLFSTLLQGFNQQSELSDFEEYADAQIERSLEVRASYLSNIKQKGGNESDGVTWGLIDNTVGYMNISRMDALTDTAGGDDLPSVEEDLVVLSQIMDEIMTDFQQTQAMIIDVRTNTGGYDAVSMEIANHFATEEKTVMSKYARDHEGSTSPVTAMLKPVASPYTKPVVILVSRDTVSAGEIFLLAMKALPNVRLVGERSNGALSNVLNKGLPNGWDFSLSNEVYLDQQGNNYEVSGIPVDVSVSPFSLEGFAQGKDNALEAAYQALVQ